ncbi:MAG TPA: retron Ec67 family RNA-directed DNA polymerase/endonuclease [Allosphingosinicella sp.]
MLRATVGLSGVAPLLGFRPKALAYMLYKVPETSKYTEFQLHKRSGGKRTIRAPVPELKTLQRRLSILLQDCVSDINQERGVHRAIAHGFRRNCSIVSNASSHKHKRYVLNMDLEGFFDAFNFGRVRGFFISNHNFSLPPETATVLAQIACYDNGLPQGSPCSPVISNLIGHIMDMRLVALAKEAGCAYSRYADDITFSTNKLQFPSEIALRENETHVWVPSAGLESIIQRSGFAINQTKTRMQYRQSRQDVTGLVVNAKVNTRIEYYREARSKCNALFNSGKYYNKVFKPDENGNLVEEEEWGTVEQLNGVLSFIDFVKVSNLSQDLRRPLTGPETLYTRFLLYRYFFAHGRPLIICEGKTDNIYVRAAITRLAPKHKTLVRVEEGKPELQISLFNYTATTARLLGLSGGTGGFNQLAQRYRTARLKFKSEGESQPVIFLVDNDSGAECVFSAIRQHARTKQVDKNKPFYRLGHNLYVVLTPRTGADGDTMIEDLFDKSIRATKLGGKSFNPGSYINQTKEYGKFLFAEHVVRKNQAKIDFSGFEPLLTRIVAAIKDHRKRVKPQT